MNNLTVILTRNCNLDCTYCFEKHSDDSMSAEVASYIVENIQKYGIKRVSFFGGETLLNWSTLCFIIEQCKSKNLSVHYGLITNGILLDENKISYLKSNCVDLAVSFDGYSHNQFRGNTDIVYNNIIRVLADIDNLTVCSVICKKNIVGLAEDMISLYISGVKSILPSLNEKECQWDEKDFFELKTEYRKIAVYIAHQRKKGVHVRFDDFDILYYVLTNDIKSLNVSNCRFCKDNFVVDTDGSIYPCVMFLDDKENSIGSISEEMDNEKMNYLIKEYSKEIYDDCKECEYNWFCHKACACRNYIKNKNYSQYTICRYIKMKFEVIKEIIDEINRGWL